MINSLFTSLVERSFLNTDVCATLNLRKKMKAKLSQLIPRKFAANLELLIAAMRSIYNYSKTFRHLLVNNLLCLAVWSWRFNLHCLHVLLELFMQACVFSTPVHIQFGV